LAAVVLHVTEFRVPLARQLIAVVFGVLKAPSGVHVTATAVLAGIPVQVRAAAVLVIVTEAIVQTPTPPPPDGVSHVARPLASLVRTFPAPGAPPVISI
jgi:hypothetical protein